MHKQKHQRPGQWSSRMESCYWVSRANGGFSYYQLLAKNAYTIAPVSTPYDGGEDATFIIVVVDQANSSYSKHLFIQTIFISLTYAFVGWWPLPLDMDWSANVDKKKIRLKKQAYLCRVAWLHMSEIRPYMVQASAKFLSPSEVASFVRNCVYLSRSS